MTTENAFPYFSIVIPTFNRKNFLEQTLDALCVQSFLNYEIIVVNDGGTDDTEMMIRERNDARIRYFFTPNRERGAARNAGVKEAKGQYVTFFDSDDIPYPDQLATAFNTASKNQLPPFFHIGYEIKDPDGKVHYSYNNLKSGRKDLMVSGNPLSCIGVFIRKDIALDFPFNEDRNLSGSEDWELWLRIVANHGIITDNHICAAIINHSDRSVKHTDPEKLYKRKELALSYSFADAKVREVYGSSIRKIEAFADSYISLHLALSGYRMLSTRYLIKSLLMYPLIVFNKRPYAIIKRILLGR